jgi:hypothetical protein
MRSLHVLFALLVLSLPASAASNDIYDIYVLACDGSTDCLRVADIGIEPEGQLADYSGPGINLRIETLASGSDSATVRLAMNLTPKALAFASLGTRRESNNSRFSFQIEPCIIKRDHFGFLGTISGGNKVYQVWGRMLAKRSTAEVVASR